MKFGESAKIAVIVALCVCLSIFLIHAYDTSPAGYAANYAAGGVWALGGLFFLVGLGFLTFKKTRRYGVAAVVGALAMALIFRAGVGISERQGWIPWANERVQEIAGPDVRASEIVYYKLGVTHSQMERFENATLYTTDRRGSEFKPGIALVWNLGPLQAHGHYGFAIGISPSMPDSARSELRSALGQSPLVFGVYHDIAPNDVPVR